MKKTACLILVLLLLLLTSCKSGDESGSANSSESLNVSSYTGDTESVVSQEVPSAPVSEVSSESSPVSSVPASSSVSSPAAPSQPYDNSATVQQYKAKYRNLYETTGTYTGRAPLPEISLTATDPANERGLSVQKFGYSFGVAKNGVAHNTSLNHQQRYKEKGYNALTVDVDTSEKRLYLTFDCGYELGYTWSMLDTLKEKNVKAVFFWTLHQLKENPELTARMIDEGHIVANHSVSHKSMPTLTRQEMAEEIEGVENYLRRYFGYTSKYFRFPTGEYSDNSLECVTSLGYRMAFWSVAYADYDTANQPGKQAAFNTVTSRLHKGAVILLHSTSESNMQALGDIIDYAHSNGYVFASLDDYGGWIN